MIIAIGKGRSMENNPRTAMAVLGLLHVVFAQMSSFFGYLRRWMGLFSSEKVNISSFRETKINRRNVAKDCTAGVCPVVAGLVLLRHLSDLTSGSRKKNS